MFGYAAFVAALSACGGVNGNESGAELSEPLFTPTGWPAGNRHTIDTCWLESNYNNPAYTTRINQINGWVRQYINASSNVTFTGFGPCTNDAPPPGGVAVGYVGEPGSSAGFDYVSVGADAMFTSDLTHARGAMLHEFMHTLGFAHEVDRDDQPGPSQVPGGDCGWTGQQLGGTKWTAYDQYSILNYTYCTAAMTILSPGDIAGIRKAYGFRPHNNDIDGTLKAAPIVWRPSTGDWRATTSASSYTSSTVRNWGTAGDQPLTGDFDLDSRADMVVFRPSTGNWHVLTSSTSWNGNDAIVRNWGQSGDVPLTADLDGDGKSEMIVFRPSTGNWHVLTSASNWNGNSAIVRNWGQSGDVPLVGDLDGDGKSEIAVFRPSTGNWHVLTAASNWNGNQAIARYFGQSGDVPRVADLDGDGKAEMVLWRASDAHWYALTGASSWNNSSLIQRHWGASGDVPLTADHDGDGRSEMIVWRPSTGTWSILWSSSSWNGDFASHVTWGQSGDQPL
jgi:hypothetical protein